MILKLQERPNNHSVRLVFAAILGMVGVRLVMAAVVPLAFDEAYYWRWSEHLSAGYFDHPPMVAYIIRAGTLCFGDTQFGVRVMSVLLALPASWAVWQTATILWDDERLAATAAFYFNLTLFIAVGTIIVTPDAPLICAAAFFAYFLAKLMQTGNGWWWLAVGAAGGLGLLSKYTAFFWPFTILLMAMFSADIRRWLMTPYPWLGGALALLIFSPTLAWNAAHDLISFRKQFGRLGVPGLSPHFLPEFIGSQVGLATPAIFALGAMALTRFSGERGGKRDARLLIAALILPLFAYLIWHSLHTRVEGNWTAPLTPAFAIAASVAAHSDWSRWLRAIVRSLYAIAAPLAVLMISAIYLQAATGVFPLGREPTAYKLGAGMSYVATEVDTLAEREDVRAILVDDHGLASWLSFYGPSSLPVFQLGAPYRWSNEPEALPDPLHGRFLYVAREGASVEALAQHFDHVERIAEINRTRGDLFIQAYSVFLLATAEKQSRE